MELLTPAIQLDLSNKDPIPKIVHISWKTKDIFENQSPVILNGIANLKRLNPTYRIEISDDQDVEIYLKNNLKRWDYTKIKNKKIVEKIDLWRLLKIYNEGGIYIDIDRYCNISFDSLIEHDTKCILPTYDDIDFSHSLMISCKENPIFKKAVEYNLAGRWLINPRGVFHLGPPLYMKAITEVVFGIQKKRKPGSEVMEGFRRSLNKSKHFQTYKENLPNDSFVFQYDETTFQQGNGLSKNAFYNSQDVTPWSSGYDKNTLIFITLVLIVILVVILMTI